MESIRSAVTDGDVTQWTYHPSTGLELSKIYADGSSEQRTYDAFNRLSTITDARGVVKSHTYDVARGLLLSESYSDETNNRTYVYNFLAMPVRISDDAGVRNLVYNSFNELETDSLVANSVTHLVTELRDNYGRSVGYTYAKNNSVQQTTSVGYDTDGL